MFGAISHRGILPGLLSLVLAFAVSPELAAQASTGQPDDPERNRIRAAELAREADQLALQMKEWSKAARTYEESALLHPEGDLEGYAAFVNAGNFHYFAGNEKAARRMFEAAGRLALENGEVYNAAVCYLNASLIAKETRELEKMTENGFKARKLVRSPALTSEQRTALMRHFEQVGSTTS